MEKSMINFILNGQKVSAVVAADQLLVDFLRDDLNLTGTKKGCNVGECGACTIIIDGNTVNSCLMLAATIDGSEVTTVEGVSKGEISALQKAFLDYGAVQCGFCTPGMLLSAKALLDKNPHPTREEIKTAISGNLCRCTGYKKIVDSVEAVANA